MQAKQSANLQLPLEKLLNEVPDGICVSDPRQPDNPVVFVNAGFCRLTGYKREEVLGRNCRFLQGPETDPQAVGYMSRSLRAGRECSVELLNYRRDGSSFWNNVSITPVHSEDGQLVHFVGVLTDMTERHLREEIERELIDNLSHELKTPLAAQIGIVETLERHPQLPDAERRELYSRLRNQTNRLIQLSEDMLSLSKLSSAKTQAGSQVIDIRTPVEQAFESALLAAQSGSIDLEFKYPDQPLLVEADSSEILMLTNNLLSNAIKYNRAGGKATLELFNQGDSACIRVSDTGLGISPQHLPHIFERFYRADSARSRRNGGNGLGLAIVEEIVLRQRGTIRVQSSHGEWTTFTVTLPLAAAVAEGD